MTNATSKRKRKPERRCSQCGRLSAQLEQAQQERDQLKEQFGIQARIDGERIWKLEAQLTEAQATIARLTPAHE